MQETNPTDLSAYLEDAMPRVRTLARRAGGAILEIYRSADVGAEAKEDGSPLTRADLVSHRVLTDGLRDAFPDVPVLSEESAEIPYDTRRAWTQYWLVDPLDGTKEFLKRNGEFTVNVALIDRGRPVLGVVHVPVSGATYSGALGRGAHRHRGDEVRPIRCAAPEDGHVRVVASRSHRNEATDAFIEGLAEIYDEVELTSSGSSLKLCRVAEGAAHYYPRVAPTMEWDTAAAQAVVEAAGGVVWRYGTREPLAYGKRDLHNPHFLVAYAPDAPVPDPHASRAGEASEATGAAGADGSEEHR